MESKQAFGGYIKEKRQAKGLSQRELAQKLYVTESAVSKWERGVSYPDITQITPLCEALDVSEHELITASDDERQRRMEREVETHRKVRLAWLIAWSVIYLFVIVGAATTKNPLGPFPYDIARAVVGCLRDGVVHPCARAGEIGARHDGILFGIPVRESLDAGGVWALWMGGPAELQHILRRFALQRERGGRAVCAGMGDETFGRWRA